MIKIINDVQAKCLNDDTWESTSSLYLTKNASKTETGMKHGRESVEYEKGTTLALCLSERFINTLV